MEIEIGKKYNKLLVLQFSHKIGNKKYYLCKCDCGNTKKIYKDHILSGHTKSCGCISRVNNETKHNYGGITKNDRLYRVYRHMLQRCHLTYNDRHKKYYQDKGIKVCDEWKNDFLKFKEWALENGYDYNAPYGQCTIDRINPDGDYEPSNCRWITKTENSKRVIHKKEDKSE